MGGKVTFWLLIFNIIEERSGYINRIENEKRRRKKGKKKQSEPMQKYL